MSCVRCDEELASGLEQCRHCGAPLPVGQTVRLSSVPSELEDAAKDAAPRRGGLRPFVLGFVGSLVLLLIGLAVGLALNNGAAAIILALAGPIALIALAVVKEMPSAAWGSAAAIVVAPLIVFGGCLMLLSRARF